MTVVELNADNTALNGQQGHSLNNGPWGFESQSWAIESKSGGKSRRKRGGSRVKRIRKSTKNKRIRKSTKNKRRSKYTRRQIK
jgi:hypothetical protein